MNKQQKEIQQVYLDNEERVLKDLKKVYSKSLTDIDGKIAELMGRADKENLQSIIYQVEYQKALKQQINGILDTMNTEQFTTVSEYLTKCYEDGFVGVMYDLKGQGIPLITPIDQKQVQKALVHDTKLSKSLYAKLGEDTNLLKKRIGSNLSRGIAQGHSYEQIAKNIKGEGNIALSKTMRIARTEGHRVTQESTYDAQKKAQENGADVVKQWDASVDRRTRPHHAQLDGQIRELDEPFEIAGRTVQYPGGFGVPSEDINCRCVILQRARWALDEDELNTLKERAEAFGIDKTDSFEEFKKKYIKAVETDPNEGKVFHMQPDGTLVEGEISGKDTYYLNGLTGEVTPLEKGIDYSGEILSLNEDGTYSFGKVKYQAQYKANLENHKVLNVKLKDDLSELTNEEKIKKLISGMPKDVQDKIELTYNMYDGAASYESIVNSVLKKKGYQGIDVLHNGNADEFLKIFDDDLVKKTKKSKLETLTSSLKTQQKKLDKIENKTYSGIWKNDASVSDYSTKKITLEAKRNYYKSYLLENPNGANVELYKKYLDDLDEFEKLGKQYEEQYLKIQKIKNDIKKLTPKPVISGSYTQERKDNALWAKNTKDADDKLREKCGEVWRNAPTNEKGAIYDYTGSYSKYNEPQRGYEYGTNKYLGVGNVDFDQIGVNYGGYKVGEVKKQIDAMASIIDKSSYDFDIWLQRGCDYDKMDKFFDIDPSDFNLPESELSDKLLGKEVTEHAFMSTGVSKGKGFSHKPIIMNIFTPEGTKMMYVEPFSAFGNASGYSWNGISSQGSFGTESEMILQHETRFRITKVEKSNDKLYVDLEVIGQG